jgi:flagellar basal body P-ring protein FlgI
MANKENNDPKMAEMLKKADGNHSKRNYINQPSLYNRIVEMARKFEDGRLFQNVCQGGIVRGRFIRIGYCIISFNNIIITLTEEEEWNQIMENTELRSLSAGLKVMMKKSITNLKEGKSKKNGLAQTPSSAKLNGKFHRWTFFSK